MQLSPSASSASQSKIQPKYSGGIGVSGNHHLLYLSIDKQSYPYSIISDGKSAMHPTLHWAAGNLNVTDRDNMKIMNISVPSLYTKTGL